MEIDGEKDRMIGKLQERYGYAKDEARRQVDEWERTQEEQGGTRSNTIKGGLDRT